jgi:flagellar biosynthesis protein FlhB
MAEEQQERSREDLTEEASPHRIEEYRRRGIVAQSREVTALIAFVASGATLYGMCPRMGLEIAQFMREVFRSDISLHANLGNSTLIHDTLFKALKVMSSVGLPVCLAGLAFGILASLIQTGSIFSLEPLTPDFNRLDPLQGLQRLLSTKQMIDSIRVIFKATVVLLVAYLLLKAEILISPSHFEGEPGYLMEMFSRSGKLIFLTLTGILGVFAAVDLALQRFDHSKNLRMTKQEAKQDHREREGDPQIRARIRSAQREMARKRMMQAVRKADVIITNPTHIAVALVYDKGSKMSAPKVVAKGADFIAQKIKEVAAQAGVPLVENVPLARTLFKTVKVGQQIPHALYQAVAEVLAYVYRLKQRNL